MDGQELKILFNQDKAYLTPDRPLTFEQIGIADIAQKGFKSPAYWILRVRKYTEVERKIFCEVLSYHIGHTEFESNQKALSAVLNTLETISFKSVDTGGLWDTLRGGMPSSIYTHRISTTNRATHHPAIAEFVRPVQKQTLTKTFSIALKNVRFIAGGVSFELIIPGQNKSTGFTIINEDIREEYDSIKNYFGNILKTKKIEVTATIELSGGEVVSKSAKSPEIDRINRELIENVKFEFLKTNNKTISAVPDRNLYTMEEYFEAFGDEKLKPGTFYDDEKIFLEDQLKVSNSKHYKHLRFLSSKHACEVMKLRFTQNPFSFFFLIQSESNYHIVWETLNTAEATYIWSIEKDPDVLKLKLK
ncbi:hypothetical protein [Pedobacter zeae]|uniref:Uncharacterized protein n=1 Tax=Pedobacter zeae TaxID=1737356 RepID=A0A7W6KAD2_9SPHI|nr:hypothetical protein [Pedobacter zeae]MBB4108146.1 hypothetical protein [Pedobacter zeae]GGG94702.1 hypothetical protein GCM10007422_05200 [Pedobacter zeae]